MNICVIIKSPFKLFFLLYNTFFNLVEDATVLF